MRIRNLMIGAWPGPDELREKVIDGTEFRCRLESMAHDPESDTWVFSWEYLSHYTPGPLMQAAKSLPVVNPCDHEPRAMPGGKCFIPGCANWMGRPQ